MGLSNASTSNRAIILAALAIVSAILSNFAWHEGILWTPRLVIGDVPLLPGLFFGTVLALAIWLWVSRRIFAIAAFNRPRVARRGDHSRIRFRVRFDLNSADGG